MLFLILSSLYSQPACQIFFDKIISPETLNCIGFAKNVFV